MNEFRTLLNVRFNNKINHLYNRLIAPDVAMGAGKGGYTCELEGYLPELSGKSLDNYYLMEKYHF